MSSSHRVVRFTAAAALSVGAGVCLIAATGCHDGPLYAIKAANPYFSLKQWREDESIGVTDHVRRRELQQLASQIGTMSADEQSRWTDHLKQIYANDASPEMRRLAIAAAADLRDTKLGGELIRQGLDDSVAKVRMEACRSLGKTAGDDAARLLVATLNTDADLDVRQSAIAALANHRGDISTGSLRRLLDEPDPATRALAMSTLRRTTGKPIGDDPAAWIAALDTPAANPAGPTAADAPETQIAVRP